MTNWWKEFRYGIAAWFLREDVARIKLERKSFAEMNERIQERLDEIDKYRKSLSVVDCVREQLKGINPRAFDDTGDVLLALVSEDNPDGKGDMSQETFLAEMKHIHKSGAFHRLVSYLVRDQVLLTAKEAKELESINFGRASINGLSLAREEVERFATVFDERHPPNEEFDEHTVV